MPLETLSTNKGTASIGFPTRNFVSRRVNFEKFRLYILNDNARIENKEKYFKMLNICLKNYQNFREKKDITR